MKIVDANVLLYAVNQDGSQHEVARGWLDRALSGGSTTGFAWVVLLAFLRLSTKAAIFPRPLTVEQATRQVEEWLDAPSATLVAPTARHASLLGTLLNGAGTGGNLVNDAHLATLALERRAAIVTFDTDFARFPEVRWEYPS